MDNYYSVKLKNKNKDKVEKKSIVKGFLLRLLITSLLTIVVLIVVKSNSNFKNTVYQYLYVDSWNFAMFNEWYEDTLGEFFPFESTEIAVFNEELIYDGANLYKDGVRLKVDSNYLVPAFESGIIIFIGEKEDYGNTIIVQQIDGINLWYSNITNNNLKMYDYVDKGMLLGEVIDNNLYLIFEKEGEFLDYTKYIK